MVCHQTQDMSASPIFPHLTTSSPHTNTEHFHGRQTTATHTFWVYIYCANTQSAHDDDDAHRAEKSDFNIHT